MTLIFSAAPGTASNTFTKNLEIALNCKTKSFESGGAIGHLALTIPTRAKIIKELKLNFFIKPKLISGHIFPTKYNLRLLNRYYNIKHIIISYRNIYEQLNYFYKWQKYYLRGPLCFPEDVNFSNKNEFDSNNYNIDLNLLLVLNFYKHWFYLIQNNKLKNITLFSFKEITSLDKNYQKKIKYILKDLTNVKKIKFDLKIKKNLYKKEKFEINPRHKKLIEEFIAFHKEIDFSLII
jgi:hypothetical protein